MASILVDTDVYSYMTATDQRRAIPYIRHLTGNTILLSFITVAEQYAGYFKILKGHWDVSRIDKLEAGFRSVAIIPYDMKICRTFGDLRAAMEMSGLIVAPHDLWIAACAKTYSLALVTNNRKHFENIPGLSIISKGS